LSSPARPQEGEYEQRSSPRKTYAKFHGFPGAAMQVSGWTAVLNSVKYLYEIN